MGLQHVVYLSANVEVIELYDPVGTNEWAFNAIRAAAGAPHPLDGSALTSWVDYNLQHVVYLSAGGEVIELYDPQGTGEWAYNPIRTAAGGPPAAAGSALTSWVDAIFQHVVYLGADHNVHELYYPLGGGNWMHNQLTGFIGATDAPSADAGSALTSWADANYQHVIYLSTFVLPDGHQTDVMELAYPLSGGGGWSWTDLIGIVGAPPAAEGSTLTSWVDATFQHVVYQSADGDVIELYAPVGSDGGTGGWTYNPIRSAAGAPFPAAHSTLTSWVDANHQHVVYLVPAGAQTDEIELYYPLGTGGGWAYNPIRAAAGAAEPCGGSALTSWVDSNLQHVVYQDEGDDVIELYDPLGTGGWAFNRIRAKAGAPLPRAGSALTSWVDDLTSLSANLGE